MKKKQPLALSENMALFPSSGTGIPITIRTARVSLLYRNTTFLGGCVS